MPVKVKLDEDLPVTLTDLLNAAGYEASRVFIQGMGGWKDERLWAAIQAEGRFFITADKGFGDIRRYPPGTHAGVLVLRPDEDGIRPLLALATRVIAHYRLDDLMGTITVVTLRGVRIRRAPTP